MAALSDQPKHHGVAAGPQPAFPPPPPPKCNCKAALLRPPLLGLSSAASRRDSWFRLEGLGFWVLEGFGFTEMKGLLCRFEPGAPPKPQPPANPPPTPPTPAPPPPPPPQKKTRNTKPSQTLYSYLQVSRKDGNSRKIPRAHVVDFDGFTLAVPSIVGATRKYVSRGSVKERGIQLRSAWKGAHPLKAATPAPPPQL